VNALDTQLEGLIAPTPIAGEKGPGFTVWLTGLSGAGKTTVAGLVGEELERRGHLVERLDGDVVRTHLSNGLGFSKDDRDANVERIGWVASRLTRHGATVLVSSISPYREARDTSRAMVEEFGTFVEVYVRTSIEECARRDPKGLYQRALAGEIANFTGLSDPYEVPERPEFVLDTAGEEPEASARRVIDKLVELGLVAPEVPA
jgi:adenylyl-sulfate kinase